MEARRSARFFVGMSRTIRAQMPGLAFHITARTQNKEPLFEEVARPAIQKIIVEGVTTSDALLLSQTVMPNHFHIVLRQGSRPLGWIMQPIMRRIALLIQRRTERNGHVFERRFRSHACENADHLRRAITYTNINAVRARLCSLPDEYTWSSHITLLTATNGIMDRIEVTRVLKLFANEPAADLEQLRERYCNYVSWRMRKDAARDAGLDFTEPEPETIAGDRYFSEEFCALPPMRHTPLQDLRDKAMDILEEVDPLLDVETLRKRYLSKALVRVRDQLIAGLLQAGYRGGAIARFLRVSESKVSAVATALRYSVLG